MSSETMLEQRLAAVERAIVVLQSRLAGGPSRTGWLVEVTGSVSDEAAFREVLEIGRAIRSADLPAYGLTR
jgi:hypothetical protein